MRTMTPLTFQIYFIFIFILGYYTKKYVVEAELKSLKVAYSSLKKQIQGIVFLLGSNDKLL
jgi:hypothetical protein